MVRKLVGVVQSEEPHGNGSTRVSRWWKRQIVHDGGIPIAKSNPTSLRNEKRWPSDELGNHYGAEIVGGLVIVGVSVACIRDMLHYRERWTVYSTRMMHFSDGSASFENDCNKFPNNF